MRAIIDRFAEVIGAILVGKVEVIRPDQLERRLQLLELTRTPKRAHQVERAEVLLRRERDVGDRLLVVSVWISRQGDRPADRAPDEALILAARNVLVHECAHRRDRLRTIGRE